MYACMHVCMYACMHVCMHGCMYACMHVCMYACMYACMHVCMHVCMYACMHACKHVCMYVCMYRCIDISMCFYTHTLVFSRFKHKAYLTVKVLPKVLNLGRRASNDLNWGQDQEAKNNVIATLPKSIVYKRNPKAIRNIYIIISIYSYIYYIPEIIRLISKY